MAGKRKNHSAAVEDKVALATLKGDRTVIELAAQHGVHPTLIHAWKKQLLQGAEAVFGDGAKAVSAAAKAAQSEQFEQIGRLKMELEWVKKKVGPLGWAAADADRPVAPGAERPPAVRAARAEPLDAVLRAGGGDRRAPGPDAADRR